MIATITTTSNSGGPIIASSQGVGLLLSIVGRSNSSTQQTSKPPVAPATSAATGSHIQPWPRVRRSRCIARN